VLMFINARENPAATSAAPAPAPQPVRGWGIRSPQGFTALCLIEILDSSTRTGFLTFVAFLLIAKGVPEGWAVLAVPLILVGGMAGKLACGFLAERVGIVRTIVITEVATGAGILATLAVPGIAAFFLLPLIGVVLQGTSSVLYATIGDLVREERLPRAFGLFYTLGIGSSATAPFVLGIVSDLTSVATALVVVALLVTTTLPLTLLLRGPLAAAAAD